jgi:hypothetical protein
VLIFSLKKDTKLLSEQRPSISFELCAENIICFVFEYGHALKAEYAPPLQRITAFVCMMDPRCAQSFSNMHSYKLTMCTAIMPETWGPCARASQCGAKSLRRDVLA